MGGTHDALHAPAAAGRRGESWPADSRSGRCSGRWRHVYAALDLGTNNCRLLIARPRQTGFRVIDAFSRIVRLGEGVSISGALSDEAMERAIEALKICSAKMRRRGVTRARGVATEACRKAANGLQFLERVRRETGLELDVIDAGEEARLAALGCAPLIELRTRHALIFDIGGGSTELTWLRVGEGKRVRIWRWISLPCGVVTLAERHGGREIPAAIFQRMVDEVTELIHPFAVKLPAIAGEAPSNLQMLGTSGTVTTLAGVHLDLGRYDRTRVDGLWLSFEQAHEIGRTLREMSWHERAAHPCIGPDRADLVIAGCAILEGICRAWPVGRLRVADRGLREGLLHCMLREADREVTEAALSDAVEAVSQAPAAG